MAFDTTSAPKAQETPRAHPTLFDKQIWLDAIMRRTDLTASAKVLAWRLADHHNQNTGRCDPSLPVLAKGTGTSRSVVHDNLNALRDAGLIDWTSGNSSRSNRYQLKGVEIHDRAAKPDSPTPQRGKAPHLRLVPKDDAPASETVRPAGLQPSGLSDRQPSGQPDTNSPTLTLQGTLSPSTPSSASDGPAAPFSPSTGHQGAQDITHTNQPDRKPQATTWPDTLGWTREIRDMAVDHYGGFHPDELKATFYKFRDHAKNKGLKYTDWHKAWLEYFKGAIRIRNESRKPSKPSMAI